MKLIVLQKLIIFFLLKSKQIFSVLKVNNSKKKKLLFDNIFRKLSCDDSQVRYAESRSKKTTQLSLQSKETNVVNFMRLLVMRLVFGVASAMGLGENLSGMLGGMFVPPGAEEYNDDYGDDTFVPELF